jgi:hypothetical protein
MLSRTDSRVALSSAQVQAREHLRLLPLIRELDHINIRSPLFQRLAMPSPLGYVADTEERPPSNQNPTSSPAGYDGQKVPLP